MRQVEFRFEPPRARTRDPETSHRSAGAVGEFDADHFQRILEAIDAYGWLTIHELAEKTGLTAVQVARRCPEMPELAPHPSQTRKSPTGRPCRLWGRK